MGGASTLSSFGKDISLEKAREVLFSFVQWARASLEIEREELSKKPVFAYNYLPSVFLARFYVRENMSELERWHDKLGHVGAKQIRKCGIKGLKIPRRPFRCESCIKGKIHILPHQKNKLPLVKFEAGEVNHTDLQGPYARTLKNERYSQIFIDLVSKCVGCASHT